MSAQPNGLRKSSRGTTDNSKTNDVDGSVGRAEAATGGAAIPRIAAPRTAAYYSPFVISICCPDTAVGRCVLIIVMPRVSISLKNIAVHVV